MSETVARVTKGRLPVLMAGMMLWVAGCGQEPEGTPGGVGEGPDAYPYKVTTTIGMITDIVRQVAGAHAEVEGIMKEGVDPHLYKPTPGDVRRLMAADVIFYNGLMLEGKMQDVLVRVARRGKPVFAVTELIDDAYLLEPEGMPGHDDPHVWMDVAGWMKAVEAVAGALAGYDPANADAYRAAAEGCLVTLEKLDAYAREAVATVPQKQRVMVTAHDAFNYFGRAYGLDVRGIQGLSTESEAGVKDVNDLVEFLVTRNVGAVFVETSVADKNVRALVEGAAARGHEVTIGGTLYSDAMGPAGTYEGTYVGMIDHNVTTVVGALGGTAPGGGFQAWRKAPGG